MSSFPSFSHGCLSPGDASIAADARRESISSARATAIALMSSGWSLVTAPRSTLRVRIRTVAESWSPISGRRCSQPDLRSRVATLRRSRTELAADLRPGLVDPTRDALARCSAQEAADLAVRLRHSGWGLQSCRLPHEPVPDRHQPRSRRTGHPHIGIPEQMPDRYHGEPLMRIEFGAGRFRGARLRPRAGPRTRQGAAARAQRARRAPRGGWSGRSVEHRSGAGAGVPALARRGLAIDHVGGVGGSARSGPNKSLNLAG